MAWTAIWTEDGQDRWERFETRDEVADLVERLDRDPDLWIFSPEADDYAVAGDEFEL